MSSGRQLAWVTRNRARESRVVSIGSLVNQLTLTIGEADPGFAADLAPSIAGLVDDEFRVHCRLAGTNQGTLLVSVDRASLVYPMRQRWLLVLRDAIARSARWPRLKQVRFEYGSVGIRVRPVGGRSVAHTGNRAAGSREATAAGIGQAGLE